MKLVLEGPELSLAVGEYLVRKLGVSIRGEVSFIIEDRIFGRKVVRAEVEMSEPESKS